MTISDQLTFDDPVFTLAGMKRPMHARELKEMYGTVNIPDFVRKDELFSLLCFKNIVSKTITNRAESIIGIYNSRRQ